MKKPIRQPGGDSHDAAEQADPEFLQVLAEGHRRPFEQVVVGFLGHGWLRGGGAGPRVRGNGLDGVVLGEVLRARARELVGASAGSCRTSGWTYGRKLPYQPVGRGESRDRPILLSGGRGTTVEPDPTDSRRIRRARMSNSRPRTGRGRRIFGFFGPGIVWDGSLIWVAMSPLYPLRFQPILERYLWGGRRLGTVLGKPIGEGNDYAESWEVVDHGAGPVGGGGGAAGGDDVGRVGAGRAGRELLGQHGPQARFPLLFKYLDCQRRFVGAGPSGRCGSGQSSIRPTWARRKRG